jgi:hypothetical protein
MKQIQRYIAAIATRPKVFINGVGAGLNPKGGYPQDGDIAAVSGYVVGELGPWAVLPISLLVIGEYGFLGCL